MFKTTIKIERMACGMCEAHVNEAVRKVFKVKKITSSHTKAESEIISENQLDSDKLTNAVEACGYKVLGIDTEPYEKKGFSLFKR